MTVSIQKYIAQGIALGILLGGLSVKGYESVRDLRNENRTLRSEFVSPRVLTAFNEKLARTFYFSRDPNELLLDYSYHAKERLSTPEWEARIAADRAKADADLAAFVKENGTKLYAAVEKLPIEVRRQREEAVRAYQAASSRRSGRNTLYGALMGGLIGGAINWGRRRKKVARVPRRRRV